MNFFNSFKSEFIINFVQLTKTTGKHHSVTITTVQNSSPINIPASYTKLWVLQ